MIKVNDFIYEFMILWGANLNPVVHMADRFKMRVCVLAPCPGHVGEALSRGSAKDSAGESA